MGVSPSTLTAGIEDELIETNISHGLERERAFQVDLSRLMVGQHWRSKDNLISAAEARSSVPSESDFLGGEELFFPGGEQSEELVPMCKSFVKFLWARKKPHMPACMCVMLGLLTTVHAVLSGRIVDEITAIANTGDSIWLVAIFVVAMMVNSTARSVLFYYFERDVPEASVRQELRHVLGKSLARLQRYGVEAWPPGRYILTLDDCVHDAVGKIWSAFFTSIVVVATVFSHFCLQIVLISCSTFKDILIKN